MTSSGSSGGDGKGDAVGNGTHPPKNTRDKSQYKSKSSKNVEELGFSDDNKPPDG